jgi:hypothetical protein
MDFVLVYNHHNLCLNFCSFSCTGIRHNHFMEVKYILLQGAILFSENNWFHHEKSIRRERETFCCVHKNGVPTESKKTT